MSNVWNTEVEKTYHLLTPTTLGDGVSRFSEAMPRMAFDLETRTDEALLADCHDHPDEVTREQALYSLVRRMGVKALPSLERALFHDTNEQLRINALWLLEGMQSSKVPEIGRSLASEPVTRHGFDDTIMSHRWPNLYDCQTDRSQQFAPLLLGSIHSRVPHHINIHHSPKKTCVCRLQNNFYE